MYLNYMDENNLYKEYVMSIPLQHSDLTGEIIGASFKVNRALGPGYQELVYKTALVYELRQAGIQVKPNCPLQVHYREIIAGDCYADLVVEGVVAVELKAQESILPGHMLQLRAYMRTSGIKVGLLINFGPTQVDVKRVIESVAQVV